MYWIDLPRDHKRSSHLVKALNVNHQSLQGSRGGVVKYAGRVMGLRQTEELPRVQHGNVMRGGREAESAQPRFMYTSSTPGWGISTTSPLG